MTFKTNWETSKSRQKSRRFYEAWIWQKHGLGSTLDSQPSSARITISSKKLRKNYTWRILKCPSHLDTEPSFFFIIVELPELGFHLRLIGLVVGSFNLNGLSGRADLYKRTSVEEWIRMATCSVF